VRKENVSLNVKETHTHRTCFETKEQARRHTEKVRQSNSAKTTSSVNRDITYYAIIFFFLFKRCVSGNFVLEYFSVYISFRDYFDATF